MFRIGDRVSWYDVVKVGFIDIYTREEHCKSKSVQLEGVIVAEEEHDHYKIKIDGTGELKILCYRKLSKINED